MYRAIRRTGTYFHSLARWSAPNSVRAPQATLPMTGKVRSALMASGLRTALSSSLRLRAGTPPAMVASMPAGAFQVPLVASVRA